MECKSTHYTFKKIQAFRRCCPLGLLKHYYYTSFPNMHESMIKHRTAVTSKLNIYSVYLSLILSIFISHIGIMLRIYESLQLCDYFIMQIYIFPWFLISHSETVQILRNF